MKSPAIIGFTLEEACRLYSVLPQELDEASTALLLEDLNRTCTTIFGARAFIYPALEVVG